MKTKRKDAPQPIIVRFRNYTAKKNLFTKECRPAGNRGGQIIHQ